MIFVFKNNVHRRITRVVCMPAKCTSPKNVIESESDHASVEDALFPQVAAQDKSAGVHELRLFNQLMQCAITSRAYETCASISQRGEGGWSWMKTSVLAASALELESLL